MSQVSVVRDKGDFLALLKIHAESPRAPRGPYDESRRELGSKQNVIDDLAIQT